MVYLLVQLYVKTNYLRNLLQLVKHPIWLTFGNVAFHCFYKGFLCGSLLTLTVKQ